MSHRSGQRMSEQGTRPLGAAVIGLGIGEQHAVGYERLSGCRLVALCDQSPEQLQKVGSRFPGVRQTSDWRDLMCDPSIDVVSIASFDDVHGEQTVAALEAGKHAFVEKPLCCSADELRALRAALARRPQLALGSNLVLRAAPVYRWLRQAIAAGDFGEIFAFDGDYLYGRIEKITSGWRNRIDGYSVMRGGGIHLADLMLWLTCQRPHSVTAVGNRIATRNSNFRSADFMATTFEFTSGLIGRITANFGCVHRHQHVVRVFGDKATFLLDDQGARVVRSSDPGESVERLPHDVLPSAKWDLIPDFLERAKVGDRPSKASEIDFDTMSVCLAADKAAASGQREQVDYL